MGLYTDLKNAGLLGPVKKPDELTQDRSGTILGRYLVNNVQGPKDNVQVQTTQHQAAKPQTPWVPRLPSASQAETESKWVPRLPTLAELNKVEPSDLTPQTRIRQAREKVIADMASQRKATGASGPNLAIGAGSALAEGGVNTATGAMTFGDSLMNRIRTLPLEMTAKMTSGPLVLPEPAKAQAQAAIQRENARGQATRAEVKQIGDRAIQGIREKTGVDPEKMGTAGRVLHGAVSSLPQMLAGTPVFLTSSIGNYVAEAEAEGATPEQAFAYGVLSGATEVGLERVLGVVPGLKGLKQAGAAGLKGTVKNVAGEALEEGITSHITNGFKKLTYAQDASLAELYGQEGKSGWQLALGIAGRTGEDAAAGATMALLVTALGLPVSSRARKLTEKAVDAGSEISPQAAMDIAAAVDGEVSSQNSGRVVSAEIGNSSAFDAIDNYVRNAWDWTPQKPTQSSKMKLDVIAVQAASAVSQITGKKVEGYRIALVDNDIRHIRNSHGPETTEGIPVGPEDFLKVPDIINNFDRAYEARPVISTGEPTVRFEKRYNGKTYLLTAISEDDGTLGVKQIIKVPTDSVPKFVSKAKGMVSRADVPSENVLHNHAQSALDHSLDRNAVSRVDAPSEDVPGNNAQSDLRNTPDVPITTPPTSDVNANVKGPADQRGSDSIEIERYTPVTTAGLFNSITPPSNGNVKAVPSTAQRAVSVDTADTLDLYDALYAEPQKYTEEDIRAMSEGESSLPDDVESLQQLAHDLDAMQKKDGPVKFNLQQFREQVQEKLSINLQELHKKAKQLKKKYENARARHDLTDKESMVLADLKRGIRSGGEIPAEMNFTAISDIHEAWKAYQQVQSLLDEYKTGTKERRLTQATDMLMESDSFKDKGSVMAYASETMERNNRDVMGKLDAQRVNETYFRPIHENEAKAQRWLKRYRERIRKLNLDKDERRLVQLLGEKLIQEDQIVPGTTLRVLPGDGRALDFKVPEGTTREKIADAAKVFRDIYDEVFRQDTDVQMFNGYDPADYRKDYFPHYEAESDPAKLFLKSIGFNVDGVDLDTDIAGLTEHRKPGRTWSGFMLHRVKEHADEYDAIEGFERYMAKEKDRIWHTTDVQRLRALEMAIRQKYSEENILQEVKWLKSDKSIDFETREEKVNELLNRDPKRMANYVRNLREYTDMLAGKRHSFDRKVQDIVGTKAYIVMREMMNRTAANMVAINPGSWLTNFISLVQGASFLPAKNVLAASGQTLADMVNPDGFAEKSSFLTNRRGSVPLNRDRLRKFSDAASAPMRVIDDISANILVRAKYAEGLAQGMKEKEAMRAADAYAAAVMADRSKGALPNRFAQTNPLTKLLTQFQLEVKNQLSFATKDIPLMIDSEGLERVAVGIVKLLLGVWVFNELFERLVGRRPAPDPIGTIVQVLEDKDNPQALVANLADNTLGQLPHVGGILSNVVGKGQGGRLPVNAALPDLKAIGRSVADFAEGNAASGWKTIGAELKGPATYLLSPVGGGQIKKTVEGVTAFARGESQTTSGGMRFPIPQTFGNFAKTAIFGQYATKEAREYFDEARRPLSDSQAERVRAAEDPNAEYERVMAERDVERAKEALRKAIRDRETEAKIDALERRYREVQQELVNAQ